jgi:glycosyltransferase involved in cell wall biosynthesis
VELLVKCDYFLDHANRRTQFEGEVRRRGLDNVLAAWGDWDEPAFRSLYTEADAFVLPTRAEGWGLPIIEALACGLPVITTNYSGQTEYLSSIVGGYFPISHTVVPICDPDFLGYWDGVDACGAKWAEPDRQSLSDGLTAVVNAFENWVGRSRRASQVIRQRFGWEQAAQAGLAALATRGAL